MSNSKKIYTETYPVDGMSCASCAINVEDTLKKASGVKSAQVNFANQQATVEFDAAVTSKEILQKALQASGYDLIVASDKSLQDTSSDLQKKTH